MPVQGPAAAEDRAASAPDALSEATLEAAFKMVLTQPAGPLGPDLQAGMTMQQVVLISKISAAILGNLSTIVQHPATLLDHCQHQLLWQGLQAPIPKQQGPHTTTVQGIAPRFASPPRLSVVHGFSNSRAAMTGQ